MKILHICLASFNDGYNYQENALARQNKLDGHDVVVFAPEYSLVGIDNKSILSKKEGNYYNEDGVYIKRFPYKKWFINLFTKKFKQVNNFYNEIEKVKPDVILFHGSSSFEIGTVIKYKKNNPEVKFYIDNHGDYYNSAKGFVSREILFKILYKHYNKKAVPYIEKYLCVSYGCMKFAYELFKIPKDKLEFYPLGGEIIDGERYDKIREEKRNTLQLKNDDIIFLHTGKMNSEKKTTEILRAFKKCENDKFKLIIIGSFDEDIRTDVEELISQDDRVQYLGWKNSSELIDYLCAADVYLQPGSQSATMQNAMCCTCAMVLYPHSSHRPYLQNKEFYVKNEKDILRVLNIIKNKPQIVDAEKQKIQKVAYELLDYKNLAARLYR